MDIYQLRQFRVIAKYGNITRASEELYITQPALSISLNKLEDELGCLLFARNKKKLVLTDNGKKLLEYATQITDLADEAENFFKSSEKVTKLKLFRIGGVNYPLISKGCTSTENFYFSPVLIENSELRSVIESGEADMAIGDDRYVMDFYEGYKRELLYRQKLYIAMNKDHPLAKMESVDFSQLKDIPLVGHSNPVGFNSWINEIKKLNRTDLREEANLNFVTWLHEGGDLKLPYLMNNFGISTIYDVIDKMKVIPVNGKYTERNVYLYYREKNEEDYREFIDLIKKNVAETLKNDAKIKLD
ncbi:MAG: LysR family transcriptional regulator [Erysipelotrichaceae bacterium]|nr:LysR family transcriptional regulator [Erysipelotrichaceae bacterium]